MTLKFALLMFVLALCVVCAVYSTMRALRAWNVGDEWQHLTSEVVFYIVLGALAVGVWPAS